MPVYIRMGNLSPKQIENELGVKFDRNEYDRLLETWHHAAEFKDGDSGWHMFYMPLSLYVSNGPIGNEIIEIFMKHNNEYNTTFQAINANNNE